MKSFNDNKETLVDRMDYNKSVDRFMRSNPALVKYIDEMIILKHGGISWSYNLGRQMAKTFMKNPWLLRELKTTLEL